MPDLFGSYGFAEALPEDLRSSRAIEVIEETLRRKRLPHAILFYGEDIESLGEVAQALAGALLESDKPLQHPDFFSVRPAKKMRQIGVEPMREMIRNIEHSSHQGGRKVAVVYEADRMNNSAANAFLKTLEEPPADTTIIMLTARPYDLLDTIRSRCFNIRLSLPFKPLANEDWTRWISDYQGWLGRLVSEGTSRSATSELVLGVYGLISRFISILAALSTEEWDARKADLPEHMDDAERDAEEAGARKGLRARLFADVERATHAFAVGLLKEDREFPAEELSRLVSVLERSFVLTEVFNMKEDAALENFLLQSLRVWAAVGREE